MSWRKLQIKKKLINRLLFISTDSERHVLKLQGEEVSNSLPWHPGNVVRYHRKINHPISPERAENWKLTLFSPDSTSAPVCVVFIVLFLLWPHNFPYWTLCHYWLFFVLLLLLLLSSRELKRMSMKIMPFPVSQILSSLGEQMALIRHYKVFKVNLAIIVQ